jgi:hypothetical protein
MALASLLGLGNTVKKSIESAKSGKTATIPTPQKKNAKEALAELRKTPKPSAKEALAKLRSENTNSNAPRPLGEVLGATDAFKQAQQKSLKEGKFNIEGERQFNVNPAEDFLKDAGSTADIALKGVGSLLSGAGKNIEDVSKGQMPRIAGETYNAGQSAVKSGVDFVADPTNLIKAPVELVTGAIQQAPEVVGNLASVGTNIAKQIPGVGDQLKLTDKMQMQINKATTRQGEDLAALARKGGKIGKAGLKDLISKTGLNPDSIPSKVGELALDAYAGGKAGQLASGQLEQFGSLANKAKGVKNLGTQIIPRTTNPVMAGAQKALDFATEKVPQAADDLIKAAGQSAGFSAVSTGKAPTMSDVVTTYGANKILDFFAKGAQKKAVQKYNENVPNFTNQMGKNQSPDAVHKEVADAVRTGYVGRDAKKISDLADGKITAYNKRATALIDKADDAYKGVDREKFLQEPLEKLKQQYIDLGDIDSVNKLDDLASEFLGSGVDKNAAQLKNTAKLLDTQKQSLSSFKQALKTAKDPETIGRIKGEIVNAENRLRNVQRRLADLEKNKPLLEKAAAKPKELKLKDLEKIKQDNALLNKRTLEGNKSLSQEDDLRKQLLNALSEKSVKEMENAVPGLRDLFKQQNIGIKVKEAVKNEARRGAALNKGGNAAYTAQGLADLLNNPSLRRVINSTIAKREKKS